MRKVSVVLEQDEQLLRMVPERRLASPRVVLTTAVEVLTLCGFRPRGSR